METFFLVCAIIGGTIMVLQLGMSLLGLGLDVAGDIVGGDVGGDMGGDVGGDVGADIGDLDVGSDGADAPDTGGDHHHSHRSLNLGRFFTIQTIVAFFAFFGIGGLGSLGAGHSGATPFLTAFGVGIGAMFIIGYIMSSIFKLEYDGTVRLRRAIGTPARVYLRIPAEESGVGKVTLTIQQQTIEVQARTPGPELATGSNVVVTNLIDRDTVEVVAREVSVA